MASGSRTPRCAHTYATHLYLARANACPCMCRWVAELVELSSRKLLGCERVSACGDSGAVTHRSVCAGKQAQGQACVGSYDCMCFFVVVACQLMPECGGHTSGAWAQVDRRPWRSNDNCISLDEDVAIDVPRAYSSLATYRATVGHKANHSFMPNAKYVQVYHARFGYITPKVSASSVVCLPRLLRILVRT